MTTKAQIADAAAQLEFVLSGRAVFTLVSRKTGDRFTFKVDRARPRGKEQPPWFVSVLTGPSNTSDYAFLGTLFPARLNPGDRDRPPQWQHGRKSRIAVDAPSSRAFHWLWEHLYRGAPIAPQAELWHEGRCGACGRPLTDPESIASGLGPVCARRAA